MNQAIILSVFIVATFAAENSYASTAYPTYAKSHSYPPAPYSFNYAVKDEPSYNDFGHGEESDGKGVSGSYFVLLPDGRRQVVDYKADSYGYLADVKYEGQVKAYELKPAYKAYPAYSANSDFSTTYQVHPHPAYPAAERPTTESAEETKVEAPTAEEAKLESLVEELKVEIPAEEVKDETSAMEVKSETGKIEVGVPTEEADSLIQEVTSIVDVHAENAEIEPLVEELKTDIADGVVNDATPAVDADLPTETPAVEIEAKAEAEIAEAAEFAFKRFGRFSRH